MRNEPPCGYAALPVRAQLVFLAPSSCVNIYFDEGRKNDCFLRRKSIDGL
jgi:hypothetical protein